MQLLEKVADLDDDLMMKYLEGEELTEEEIQGGAPQRYPSIWRLCPFSAAHPTRTRGFSSPGRDGGLSALAAGCAGDQGTASGRQEASPGIRG